MSLSCLPSQVSIEVDVIVPVHNASATLRGTIESAMHQVWLNSDTKEPAMKISIHVCCYNDASTDDSWSVLQYLHNRYKNTKTDEVQTCPKSDPSSTPILTHLHISSSPEGSMARGPGYARNRAVAMRTRMGSTASRETVDAEATTTCHRFLCWLDSDDLMHPTRVYHQVTAMMQLEEKHVRHRELPRVQGR